LSARTSDVRVNQVMAVLTEHFVGPESYADLAPMEIESFVKSVPLYRQKSRYIVEAARHICYRLHGEIPQNVEALSQLPGVGRKTAAVVVGNAFGVPAVAADQHVQRIAMRVGWCKSENALRAEQVIEKLFLPEQWVLLCHQLIRLGRDCCRPRNPWCSRCPIAEHCQKNNLTESR
ncbi:MAG: endonuclease III, partial [Planctomycetes bacterium]|nr:endonuclease III [Planctomycetota bacterium]